MTKFDPIIRGHSRPSVDTFSSSPLSPHRNAQHASTLVLVLLLYRLRVEYSSRVIGLPTAQTLSCVYTLLPLETIVVTGLSVRRRMPRKMKK